MARANLIHQGNDILILEFRNVHKKVLILWRKILPLSSLWLS